MNTTVTIYDPTSETPENSQHYTGKEAMIQQLRHTADLIESGKSGITGCELVAIFGDAPLSVTSKLTD